MKEQIPCFQAAGGVLDGNGSEHMAEQIHAQHSEEFKER
jgi:hypothetical protein